jgi:hypothetical protein
MTAPGHSPPVRPWTVWAPLVVVTTALAIAAI